MLSSWFSCLWKQPSPPLAINTNTKIHSYSMATLRLAEGFLYRTHCTAWKLFNTDTFSRKVGICVYIYSQFSREGFDFSKMQLVFFSGSRNCRMEKSNREKGLRTWHAPCLGTGRRALSERHTNQSFTACGQKLLSQGLDLPLCILLSCLTGEGRQKHTGREPPGLSFLVCRVNPEETFHKQGTHAVVRLKLILLISFNKWGNKIRWKLWKDIGHKSFRC